MLPINRTGVAVANNNQAGSGDVSHTDSDINFEPSVTNGDRRDDDRYESSKLPAVGPVVQQPIAKTLNFQQAGELYRSFSDGQKANLIRNLSSDLAHVRNAEVQLTMLSHFYQADAEYGTRLCRAIGIDPAVIVARIATRTAAR